MTGVLDGPETRLSAAVDAFLTSKSKAQGGGAYASTAESVLGRFREEWAGPRGYDQVGDLDKHALAGYARYLTERVRADAITPSTAHTYYDVVAAFCAWAVRRDLLATNVARKTVALEELPAATGAADRQIWPRETAEQLLRWTTWKVDDALANDWGTPERFVRDRALVAALYYCGVRGAEVLSRGDDARRSGLRWRDVDLDGGSLPVLGKSQQREHAPLPEHAARYLRSHRQHQDPPSEDWPVFRTGHRPSVGEAVWEQLGERFGPDERARIVEDRLMLGEDAIEDLLREYELVPPPLSTSGGRHVLERLSAESGITVDGEPPKPHGARRGLGDALYRRNPVDAQEALRHRDISTTHEAYSGIKAAETSAAIDEAMDDDR